MKIISLILAVILPFGFSSLAQTKTLTVDANDVLNSNTKIVAQSSVGQIFYTGHQLGSQYSMPYGIYRAWTDNPDGTLNYFYDGIVNGTTNFSVRADGKGYFAGTVGIGTNTPHGDLEVNGTFVVAGNASNLDSTNPNRNLSFLEGTGKMLIGWNRTKGAGETDFIGNPGAGNVGGFAFYNHSNTGVEQQLMWITGDGRLLVGLSNGSVGNNKLAVGGGILAESVTVKLQANWPDYVFKPGFQLAALADVKAYFDKNHHLPEMPSAEEISKDGLNLGEMNKLLVKKVEELTIYLIEKDKNEKDQQEQINQLKSQINKVLLLLNK